VTLPDHLELYSLGVSVLVAFVLVAIGAARLVRRASAIRRRIEAYEDLSVLTLIEIAEARLRATERNAAEFPRLRARAEAAVAELATARKRLLAMARSVAFALRTRLFAR